MVAVGLDHVREGEDTIDLGQQPALDGQQDLTWLGSAGFSGAGGELRASGPELQADINGDGITDLKITVLGVNTLKAGDVVDATQSSIHDLPQL